MRRKCRCRSWAYRSLRLGAFWLQSCSLPYLCRLQRSLHRGARLGGSLLSWIQRNISTIRDNPHRRLSWFLWRSRSGNDICSRLIRRIRRCVGWCISSWIGQANSLRVRREFPHRQRPLLCTFLLFDRMRKWIREFRQSSSHEKALCRSNGWGWGLRSSWAGRYWWTVLQLRPKLCWLQASPSSRRLQKNGRNLR